MPKHILPPACCSQGDTRIYNRANFVRFGHLIFDIWILKFDIRKMKNHLIHLSIFLLSVWISGCTQFAAQKKEVIPGPEPVSPLMINGQDLDRKIISLQERIRDNKVPVKDQAGARELLGIYRLLKEASNRPMDNTGYRELINRVYERASGLDSVFLSAQEKTPSPDIYVVALFSKMQRDIVDAYLSGDERGVINKVLALEKTFGPDALTPQVGLVFALSLAHEGLLEEAVDVGERVARELEQRPGLILLETRIAQWYARLGRDDEAMLRYERLTDVMDDNMAMVNGLKKELARSPAQSEGQPDQGAAEKSEVTISGSSSAAFQPLMKQVEERIQAHDFTGARDLLIQKQQEALSPSDKETLDQALKSVAKAEDVFLAEKMASLSREKAALKRIRGLMEDEKYEEAVSGIEGLKSEGMQSAELKTLELEATEKLINQERKRAAGLFLKAKNAKDLSEKRRYLNMSRELLQNLLYKFPSSPLYENIKSNLESVNEALGKL
jgi:hypothetical protein